jgi:iron(III) transport system substrate-binding protein
MLKPILAAAIVLLVGLRPAQAQTDDELYAKAKAEGTVNFAGAMKQKETDQLLRQFERAYPGIHVTYTRRATEPMVQLIEADRLSGKTSFDIINLTEPGEMVRYKRDGFFAATDPVPTNTLFPGTYDQDGAYRAYGLTPMYGLVNTDALKPAERPKSLAELFTPKWKGRIVISQPSRGGTDSAALMAVEAAVGPDFAQRAKDLDILLTRGNEAAINAVIAGERPVSWGVSGYRALDARAGGPPVQIVLWKEGTAVAGFYGGVVAKAPHPNAARLLDRWLMSQKVQEQVVDKLSLYSARQDVAATPDNEPHLKDLPLHFYSADEVAAKGQAAAKAFEQALGVR